MNRFGGILVSEWMQTSLAQVAEWMGAEMWAALAEEEPYAGTSVGRSKILMVRASLEYRQRDHVKVKTNSYSSSDHPLRRAKCPLLLEPAQPMRAEH